MTPIVSVIVANYNNGPYTEAAIRSALDQTLHDIEVIVVDDASTDDSFEIASRLAQTDPRLRVFRSPTNRGISATRNRGIEEARGKWIAILDGDDIYHLERLAKLIPLGEKDEADIIADDVGLFGDENPKLGGLGDTPFWIDAVDWITSTWLNEALAPRGYLKPIIRAELLRNTNYNPALRFGEDYDLILRLLLQGARMRVYPAEVMYHYRRHNGSVTHELSRTTLFTGMRASEAFFRSDARKLATPELQQIWPELQRGMLRRHAELERKLVLEDMINAVHQRRLRTAVKIAMMNPYTVLFTYVPRYFRVHVLGTTACGGRMKRFR